MKRPAIVLAALLLVLTACGGDDDDDDGGTGPGTTCDDYCNFVTACSGGDLTRCVSECIEAIEARADCQGKIQTAADCANGATCNDYTTICATELQPLDDQNQCDF